MRYAIFSDIHANLRAWEQVLADIREQRADVLVCLGDVVGYGPKPEEVLSTIRGVTDNFVMGNHDAAAAGAIETSYFNEHARSAIEWTIAALSDEAREFLASVPLAIEAEDILFVHAEICEPGRFSYIEGIAEAHDNFDGSDHFVTFVGHTHYPCVFELSNDGSVVEHPDANCQLQAENRYIVNVGSVGEPRNPDDLRGRYVIYDSETRAVEFHGVSFDISAYRADLDSTTLSIKPYFLQVFDHLLGDTDLPFEEAVRAIDMDISDDVAPLIQKRRGPAKLHVPTTPIEGGDVRGYAGPQPEEESNTIRTVLFVAIGAVFTVVIALVAFMMTGGETKSNTVVGEDPPPTTPIAEITPVLPDEIVKPPTPVPKPEPKLPVTAVVAMPIPPVVSIDFNLSAGANQSGTPLNVDGLTLEGQEGAWHDLQIGAEPDTDTMKELSIDTGEGVFTLNSGGAGAYRAFSGGGDELRQDGVLLNAETAGPIEWSLSGLTPLAGYDLILFAQADNGLRGNPVDFAILGHGDGEPVELDSDNDGNFTKVDASARGEIQGTFALRSGEAHSGWAGLQFRKTSDPVVAATPPAAGRKIEKQPDIVFEDFETPDYAGWQVTGEAFGQGPVAIEDIPEYQLDVNGVGKRVVNSHASAPGDSTDEKDNATGSLLSRPFRIERSYITFRIGGGEHGMNLLAGEKPGVDDKADTGVSLMIDGKVVRSLTGHNHNKMRSGGMDVSSLRGRTGRLMIVDAVSGGWGNIGVDQIVFTDTAAKPDSEPIAQPIAQPNGDPAIAWWRMEADSAGTALADAMKNHPLPATTPGVSIGGLAPSAIPANGIENNSAFGIGVWAESAPVGVFALGADRSFTLEGWVLTGRPRRPIFLAGTRSGDANDSQGWHVDIRPPSNEFPNGQMAFFYDHGPEFIQALSEDIAVADLKPHHFAAVWDHDAAVTAGEMRLYLDGDQVATTEVPHSQIPAAQANPFRIGAPANPPKIGLDEVRFSHAALGPLEFLRAEPQTMTKNGKWADAVNWSGGEPPSGTQTAVIGPGVAVRVEKAPAEYAGDLVLGKTATVTLINPESFAVLPGRPSKLILNQGSQLIVMSPNNASGKLDFDRIELTGAATIWGGRSTSGHHTKRLFSGEISGPGALVLDGVNNNEFVLGASNSFEGGFLAKTTQNQGFHVVAKAAGSLGSGSVEIAANASLFLDAADAFAPQATLTLTGGKDSRSPSKVILNANNTVSGLMFDGTKQAAGTWGAPGSGADHEHANFSGSEVLTVTR